MSYDGFYGQILLIDLSKGEYTTVDIDDSIFAKALGGKGLGAHLLLEYNPRGVNPISPDNSIIFTTGPVANSLIWGSGRYGVFTKSPQTGFFSESYSGGKVSEAIDATGFDAIILKGKCNEPSIVVITPDGAEIVPAGDLWRKDTYVTEEETIRRYKKSAYGRKCGAIVIGPAGENLVKFAVIENDKWRSAGRTGVGTVLGSKLVKAVLFQGDKRRNWADPEGIKEFSRKIISDFKDSPGVNAYKGLGTPMMVKIMNQRKAFPNRYWSSGYMENWEEIGADTLHSRFQVTPKSCAKCFIACSRLTTIEEGPRKGLTIEGPEYETIFSFGGLCHIRSLSEIAHLNDLCDSLGLDTITTGNLCAFTILASELGKIDYKISWGEVSKVADLVRDIAYRKGIGGVLANGIIHAAKEWGMEDFAVHVKGLEPPGYDPRVLKGMALAYATSDRGACHLRATMYRPELVGEIDPDQIEGKAKVFIDYEDRLNLMDALILCRFYRDIYQWDNLGKIIELTTGEKKDKDGLREIASNILNLARKFNLREGLSKKDEELPKIFYEDPINDGDVLNPEDVEKMLQEYYELRGWEKLD